MAGCAICCVLEGMHVVRFNRQIFNAVCLSRAIGSHMSEDMNSVSWGLLS